MRPEIVCYCRHISPLHTRTRVLLLQHPRERDVPVNTARMAHLCLPRSDLRVGVWFGKDPVVRAAVEDLSSPTIVLFPGPGSQDLATSPHAHASPASGPVTLIVLDGTWWQAEKLFKSNPELHALPRYGLTPESESRYRIRREPAAHCVATIEAVALALRILEDAATPVQSLLVPFDAMVETQLGYIGTGQPRARHRLEERRTRREAHAKTAPKPLSPQAASDLEAAKLLAERWANLIVLSGESNAWPYDDESAPGPEIVHLTALRIATGERFQAVIAPRNALAPNVPQHTGLTRERLVGGETFAAFVRRFSAFVGPDAVFATWGHHAIGTVAAEALEHGAAFGQAPRIELRAAARAHLARARRAELARRPRRDGCAEGAHARVPGPVRIGALVDFAAALGVGIEPPWAEGRAGARLAALTAIAHGLGPGRVALTPEWRGARGSPPV